MDAVAAQLSGSSNGRAVQADAAIQSSARFGTLAACACYASLLALAHPSACKQVFNNSRTGAVESITADILLETTTLQTSITGTGPLVGKFVGAQCSWLYIRVRQCMLHLNCTNHEDRSRWGRKPGSSSHSAAARTQRCMQ